jgi:hypothetical protein
MLSNNSSCFFGQTIFASSPKLSTAALLSLKPWAAQNPFPLILTIVYPLVFDYNLLPQKE